jgi:hypothetical protein
MLDILNKNISKFKEIDYEILNNIYSFDDYSLNNQSIDDFKNQLFSKDIPPFSLVNKILLGTINKELNENIYYEFSRKQLNNKNIIKKIEYFIPELKKYYLKCKHNKYLEKLNEKKIITLLRQLLRPYDYMINAVEKYNNGEKYLLYSIIKKKNISLKKINSVINFD